MFGFDSQNALHVKLFRFVSEVTLTGVRPVKFTKEFIYLKPAIKWIFQWTDRLGFEWASVYDLDKRSMCWVSDQGLLLEYRTVKAEEVPPSVTRKKIRRIA